MNIGIGQTRPSKGWFTWILCAIGMRNFFVPAPFSPGYYRATPRETKEFAGIIMPRMGWEALSDEELIARSRTETNESRSRQYVDELFRRHHVKVARWCLSFTNDRETAADLAQDICAKAYRNLSSFLGQSKFSTWLYSIARNHCINEARARSGAGTVELGESIVDTLPDLASEHPDAAIEREQLVAIARQLVSETLEETERTVFTLHFGEELPLDVITRMLNLTNASGAKAYLVSAKRKLERAVRIWKARA
jgi:RNA polymerase sigma-70 factor (ECF subfamily)